MGLIGEAQSVKLYRVDKIDLLNGQAYGLSCLSGFSDKAAGLFKIDFLDERFFYRRPPM